MLQMRYFLNLVTGAQLRRVTSPSRYVSSLHFEISALKQKTVHIVELVTFLAGLNKSSFRSLSAIPLLQITLNPFCTFAAFAAILHCLEVTGGNSGGKKFTCNYL